MYVLSFSSFCRLSTVFLHIITLFTEDFVMLSTWTWPPHDSLSMLWVADDDFISSEGDRAENGSTQQRLDYTSTIVKLEHISLFEY